MSLFRRLALLGSILLVVLSCDQVELSPTDTSALESPTSTYFTTIANDELIINTYAIPSLLYAEKFNIINFPIYGTIFKRDKGILQYKNNNGIQQVEDIIEIELLKKNKVYRKETITISVVPDNTYLLCNAGAMQDRFIIKKEEPQTFNVLSNDHFCQKPVQINEFTIAIPPKNGTAKLQSDYQIMYTPNPTFEGNDTLIYNVKYNNAFGTSSTTTALVTIQVGNITPTKVACKITLLHDQTTFLVENLTKKPPAISVDVLKNDVLCNTKTTTTALSIATNPKYFDAKIDKNNLITLSPNALLYTIGDTWKDELTYKYGENSATLTILPRNNASCKPLAIDDIFVLSIKNEKLQKEGAVTLDVLKNDILCTRKIRALVIEEGIVNKYGELVVNGTQSISFIPKNNVFKIEQFVFKYRVVDEKLQSSAGKVLLKIE
jgi:Bacterial Ig domain